MIVITSHELLENGRCRTFRVVGTIDDRPLSVIVTPWCGEYEYETSLPDKYRNDDEAVQIAIGQHFVDTNTDVGVVGR
jgi:hypothetical protein